MLREVWQKSIRKVLCTGILTIETPEHCLVNGGFHVFILVLKKQHVSDGQNVSLSSPAVSHDFGRNRLKVGEREVRGSDEIHRAEALRHRG